MGPSCLSVFGPISASHDDTAPTNGDNMTGAAGGNISVPLAPPSVSFPSLSLPPSLARLLLEQSRVDNLWSSGPPTVSRERRRKGGERKNMISLS